MSKIKVENIVKTFNKHSRNKNKVLKGVSFELPDKGLVCIFGKSGSGKTTLLNIIGGLEKADEGKVYIDGELTNGKTDKIRNEKIGFIFQNYYLEKGYTISEILRNQMIIAGFKDESEIERRTIEALKLVEMERFKNKRGDALSGGQQQRVAIARAIVKGSDIILADEPTGNLDAENTMKVMDILKEISKTQLVVIVTHEVSLIKKYADSHIKIVDGLLVEDASIDDADLAPTTYDNVLEQNTTHQVLNTFEKSTAKRNGRLFNLSTILKRNKESSEKAYSVGNIFKQIFILAMAIVITFFAYQSFEALRDVSEYKTIGENSVYTSLNSYSVLRKTDESHYKSIDFFDTKMSSGTFSYGGIASLSGIELNYTPKAIEEDDQISVEYGRLPNKGEVIVSRAMAEALKAEFGLKELNTDKAITLMTFNQEYYITGITQGNDKIIYLNKEDYVNFLGVYNKISFSDVNEIFFKDSYQNTSYTSEILVYDGDISNDKVRVEINRNSLYKMMSDTTEADYLVNKTNSKLKTTPYAIQLSGSKVYVEQFIITRDVMDTDIRIYVNKNVLKNIFVYIAPNLDALSSSGSNYYFEITTENSEQLKNLKLDLRDLGVTSVNINALYQVERQEERADALSGLYLYIVIIVLLLIIYFFIEKSASITSSKEYGIYRAIGVNKSNLLFKEVINTIVHNILSFFIFMLITSTLVLIRYQIMNVNYSNFVGLVSLSFVIGSILMIFISLIPYLFVLTKSPSEILSRYDI